MKIVINTCYGGYGLSAKAIALLKKLKTEKKQEFPEPFFDWKIARDDSELVQVVEQLGSKIASGNYACLKIIEIPDGVDWTIREYDGIESVEETHRSWS